MELYTGFGAMTPWIKDVPVYDGSAVITKGALLQRRGTGTSAMTFVEADTGVACLGIALETTAAAPTTALAGVTYIKAIISPHALYRAEYDSTSYENPSASTSTTITVGSLEDDIDGGWIADILDTDEVTVRFITASASGSCTIERAVTVTTSSRLLKILPIGHRFVGLSTDAIKLTSAAAAGSGVSFTVVDNLVKSETLGGIVPLRYADRTKLLILKKPTFYSILAMNDHIYAGT